MPELKCINSFLRNSTELNRMPLCSDFNISEVFTWCLVPLTQNCKIGGGLDPPYSFSRDFLEWSFSCSKLDTKISEQIKFSGENGNYSLSTMQTYRCSSRLVIQTEKQLAQKWSFVLRFFGPFASFFGQKDSSQSFDSEQSSLQTSNLWLFFQE